MNAKLYIGSDAWTDMRIAEDRAAFLTTGKELNLEALRPDEAEAARISSALTAMAFGGGGRMVILWRVDEWASELRELLASLLESADESTRIAVTASRKDRIGPIANINNLSLILEKESQQDNWRQLLHRQGFEEVDEPSSILLERLFETEGLGNFVNEVAKLRAYLGPDASSLDIAAVRKLSAFEGAADAFELGNAIADRDWRRANIAIGRLGQDLQAIPMIVGALAYTARGLMAAKAGDKAGYRYREPARNWSQNHLRTFHDELCRLDLDGKGSKLAPDILLGRLVSTLAAER